MKRKFMSSLLIGAFVFGFGTANVQTVSASSPDKVKEISTSYDKNFVSDKSKRPEPPKDKDGNPLPPPTDENGNPLPPPNFDGKDRPEPPKDKDGNPLPPPTDENGNPLPPPDRNK